MATDANNIILGAATISFGGVDLGHTTGGTEYRYEPADLAVESDQSNGVVKKFRTLEKMFVKTTMLEITLENLRIAFMQPPGNKFSNKLIMGYNDACWTDEQAVVLVGKSPSCGTRTVTFTKCVTINNKTVSMQRDAVTELEVEFECLKDSSGNFGTIIDS